MEIKDLLNAVGESSKVIELVNAVQDRNNSVIKINGVCASFVPLVLCKLFENTSENQFVILENKEIAAYFYNDLSEVIGDKKVLFFPSSYSIKRDLIKIDTTDVVLRTEVLDKIGNLDDKYIIVTWADAILEKVIDREGMIANTLSLQTGSKLSMEFISEVLYEYKFERVDFVFEPGQFSVRGGIVDVFSFSYDQPIRIDFFGNEIDSIRFFDIESQLSKEIISKVSIVPNIQVIDNSSSVSLFEYISKDTVLWLSNGREVSNSLEFLYSNLVKLSELDNQNFNLDGFSHYNDLCKSLDGFNIIEFGQFNLFKPKTTISFNVQAQVAINKNFDILADYLNAVDQSGGSSYILSSNLMQIDRIKAIFDDKGLKVKFKPIHGVLHEGFIDKDLNISIYTDHQIFDRYHKYNLRNQRLKKSRDILTVKDINSLKVGDYVVHIDHGIGKFVGLQKIDVNGNAQETIRLVYKDNDVLFVGIHSLHKISKYKGKDAEPPRINKLGSSVWTSLTSKTKKKVKDIARDLIQLYAQRKKEKAYSFSPDSYLQEELEASFVYEDTPDQYKATIEVKKDMECDSPMDRLVCGDVGFGKTEIAIRAAFKAVADSKQVAILVPTTILAFQHFNTFVKRLDGMPCRIEYISRLRKPSDVKKVLKDTQDGKVDILIGTHRLVGKDVVFKDLGLLVIDEEQKFGVAVKEKLKQLKLNVDTLTLTATPIPRTLQFSLMGARDLSIIKTPPPNRYPIETELSVFDEDLIAEAITFEISRNGQVFFIHNRVQSIYEIEALIQRLVPSVKTVVGHGQMDGAKLEKVMLDFMRGDYDVLIATTIIESGLDIPNANTIIINQAQNHGLSDLHQLRGRVGRSNKKAFCYLLAPPVEKLSTEAKRRLKAIEDFSELGSGFNIAMQDLDIRGAGNLLGGEQSGFINDIGYESFQRILKEAMLELKETEFEELFYEEGEVKKEEIFVSDCHIDTDSEVLIPDSYVENIAERIRLYRELDNIETAEELIMFENRMRDRFGDIPNSVKDLFIVVRVRWMAIKYGFEKIILKDGKLVLFFVSNQDSPYYNSEAFSRVLRFVQNQKISSEMKEKGNKLTLSFNGVKQVKFIEEIMNIITES